MLGNKKSHPSVVLMYHFFYPDDVVSARHFSDFGEELVKRGWKVSVVTSNRFCRYWDRKIPHKRETWNGMEIIRVSRPGLNQANDLSRALNALWIMGRWLGKFFTLRKEDVVIIGSDPQFSQLIFPFLRLLRKKSVLAFWCYDLYPEGLIAKEKNGIKKLIGECIKNLIMKRMYHYLDLLVDIGPCMRKRFDSYNFFGFQTTLTPWALVEPERPNSPDPRTRKELFGDAQLALLYSGNLGKSHEFLLFLELARRIKKINPRIIFCFACRGNRYADLKEAVKRDDQNIKLASFVEESELEKRLSSADIHLISLRPQWEGIVVPSKFFV